MLSIRATEGDDGVTGEISFVAPNLPDLHRQVRGASCDEVLDALSFAYQVHLDRWENSDAAPKQSRAETGSPKDGVAEPKPTSAASSEAMDSGIDNNAVGSEIWPRETKLRLTLGPTADWSYSPDMALGLALAAHLRLWRQHWLGLTLGYAQTGFFGTSSDLFQTDAVSVDLGWMGSDRVGSSPFHLGLEVDGRLNLMDVAWQGIEAEPSPGFLTSFAALVLLDLSAEITPYLELGMSFGGAAILAKTQPRQEIEGQHNFQQPSVGGLARFSVVASF